MKYGIDYQPTFTPDPRQVADLIRVQGLTRKDVVHSDGGEKINDRILTCFMGGGPVLVPHLGRSDLLSSFLLILPPNTNVDDWDQFWREVLGAMDESTTQPTVPGVHGKMTVDEYMDAFDTAYGRYFYARGELLGFRYDAYSRWSVADQMATTFAQFIEQDQWLGKLLPEDGHDPITGVPTPTYDDEVYNLARRIVVLHEDGEEDAVAGLIPELRRELEAFDEI